jgi:rare lipoprotein A
MLVRLGAALCVVAVIFVYSSPSAIKSGKPSGALAAPRPSIIARPQSKLAAAARGVTLLGTASTYNPLRSGNREGGIETASGERYDPNAWTAAIQIDLRDIFGGVRYGRDYRPAYALVAKDDKRAVIKINDVGELEPGRLIDFNERTMRYFDPTLGLGLISLVEVTPLLGDDWSTGPVSGTN